MSRILYNNVHYNPLYKSLYAYMLPRFDLNNLVCLIKFTAKELKSHGMIKKKHATRTDAAAMDNATENANEKVVYQITFAFIKIDLSMRIT